MPVPSPNCQWPTSFAECGPVEDPSIVLTGTATIGNAQIQVVAIRMSQESRRRPDYKSDVCPRFYAAGEFGTTLETLLEEFEYVGEQFDDILVNSGSALVEFPTGHYMLMILPAREVIG